MSREANVVIHFKDMQGEDEVRDHLHERCQHLANEFPETTQYELTLEAQGGSIQGHCHVTGKKTSVAASQNGADNPRQAGDIVLDKVARELRKEHDKRIFGQRRKAQKERDRRLG